MERSVANWLGGAGMFPDAVDDDDNDASHGKHL